MAAGDGAGDGRERIVELALELEALGQDLDLESLALVGTGEQRTRPCRVMSGRIEALPCRYGRFVFRHLAGRTSITLLRFEEDEEQPNGPLPSLGEKIPWPDGVELLGPALDEGKLYQFPVELWPVEVGGPAETLGIGTWEPFENLDRDFTAVFVRENGAWSFDRIGRGTHDD